MIPDPLHPAVVHFPIALAVLTPLAAVLAALAIASGRLPARAWAGVVVLYALLAGSGWLAVETGEREEERVERVVAERHIEAHEESAERFLLLAGVGLALAAAGLLAGRAGGIARAAAVTASLAALAAAMVVGSEGGELVYRHGASLAYTDQEASTRAGNGDSAAPRSGFEDEEDGDDD
jgi:uncharacterized membrane protein